MADCLCLRRFMAWVILSGPVSSAACVLRSSHSKLVRLSLQYGVMSALRSSMVSGRSSLSRR